MAVAASPSPMGSTVTVMFAYSVCAALKASICALVNSTAASATQTLISPSKPVVSATEKALTVSSMATARSMDRNFFISDILLLIFARARKPAFER